MTSPETTRCNVYWIHLPEHVDMFSQGYVGITTQTVEKRFAQHVASRKNNTINNAVRKYGGRLICEKVLESDVTYCRDVENKLRPTPNLGWNINIGGDLPPMTGRKHSDATRKRMSENNNRELSRAAMFKNIVAINPWDSRAANKLLWLNAQRVYEAIQENPDLGYRGIQRTLGINRQVGNVMNIFNKIKNTGYIPNKDPDWVKWTVAVNQGVLS